MEHMTKHQLILLVLLVSFVTALVTGIVTVTLVSQSPQPITQTIQKVIERSQSLAPELLKKDETAQLEISALTRDALIEDIINRASPAVVSVIATKDIPVIEQYFVNPLPQDDFFNQFFPNFKVPQYRQNGTENKQVSAGSGFFVTGDGYVVTNRHVVEDKDAEYSLILNDGRKFKTKVIAKDPLNDLAILKADGTMPAGGFTSIQLGDSSSAKIGQTAIAIGNALGEFQNTVSVGVISGLKRTIEASGSISGTEELSEVIQTDAAINPGNSGGPLLNLKGEMIGLNTAMAQGADSIGFSIPINQIKRSIDDAKLLGKIVYPYIGVRYVMVTPDIQTKNKLKVGYGALISKGANDEEAVALNSPASRAGIKEGDVILEFAGVKVDKDHTLNKLIQSHRIGDKVIVKILRMGNEIKLDLTLEEQKAQ